jgi:trans-aconitate methyltransferase
MALQRREGSETVTNNGARLEWRAEVRPCPLCGSARYHVLGSRGGASHRAGAGIETLIVRCRNCHGVYPRPTLIPSSSPYETQSSDDYFRAHDPRSKAEMGRRLAERALEITGRTGRMLELGCGRGDLLLGAREIGWLVRGVDMTPAFVEDARARGLDVESASLASCRSLDESWDVILLAAVLEHLYEPHAALARVFDSLTPGGVAFIDVPNECSLWTRIGNAYMRLRRRPWAVNLSPTFSPYHVVGFCARSLKRLLSDMGFEVIELTTTRWQNELPSGDTIMSNLEHAAATAVLRAGVWFGAGAGITAWARKPSGLR